jgi:hypothetical protein
MVTVCFSTPASFVLPGSFLLLLILQQGLSLLFFSLLQDSTA